jgi:hypothetical protein
MTDSYPPMTDKSPPAEEDEFIKSIERRLPVEGELAWFASDEVELLLAYYKCAKAKSST